MKLIFSDPAFSFQLLRTIGSSYYEGADIGECLSTAYRIKEGDFESWYTEWYGTADRVCKYGDECLSLGHKVSAREAYLRASSYYRTAEFFLHENPEDPRIVKTWQDGVSSFNKAAKLFPHYFESLEIPYEGTTLPGYFYSPSVNVDRSSATNGSKKERSKNIPRPTLILHTGFDGTQEELYSQCVVAALQRGYNCVTFEGPGQGRVIRKQGIPFRYDWEKVVTPVIDYVLNSSQKNKEVAEVSPNRIALMGISLGGFLAARAAAFDNRISACILNDGVFDVYESFVGQYRNTPLEPIMTGTNADLVNVAVLVTMGLNLTAKWAFTHGMWVFGVTTPFELIRKITDFNLRGIAEKIRCPTLVMEAQEDESFPGQPKMVYDALTCPKKYILFTKEEGAEDHCHLAALSLANQRIFDWLDGLSIRE
ncbi:MAG: alpha/beta hydrolase [Candidatus Nitrosopolaris sp.]